MIHLPTTVFDCNELVANLRTHDRAEVVAARGSMITALDLWASVEKCDERFSVFSGDGLICIYGLAQHPTHPHVGVVWLLGTPLLDRHMFSLCREAKLMLAQWHKQYAVLTNMTDQRNRRILRWLKWLGFKFVNEVPIGPEAIPFIIFQSVRHV